MGKIQEEATPSDPAQVQRLLQPESIPCQPYRCMSISSAPLSWRARTTIYERRWRRCRRTRQRERRPAWRQPTERQPPLSGEPPRDSALGVALGKIHCVRYHHLHGCTLLNAPPSMHPAAPETQSSADDVAHGLQVGAKRGKYKKTVKPVHEMDARSRWRCTQRIEELLSMEYRDVDSRHAAVLAFLLSNTPAAKQARVALVGRSKEAKAIEERVANSLKATYTVEWAAILRSHAKLTWRAYEMLRKLMSHGCVDPTCDPRAACTRPGVCSTRHVSLSDRGFGAALTGTTRAAHSPRGESTLWERRTRSSQGDTQ